MEQSSIQRQIRFTGFAEQNDNPYMHKYGYGLGVDSFETHKRIGHSGGIPGFVSYNVYYPGENIHIVVLSNNEAPSPAIAAALASILFDKDIVLPYKHQAVVIHSEDLERYVGKYQFSNGPRKVVLKEGKLYLSEEGGDDIELIPESNHKFFFADGSDEQLNFELNKDHSIRKIQMITSGYIETIKKMD